VTFTPVSFKTSCSGGGKKSATTSMRPSRSSVYLGVRFIDPLASAPIAGADNANHVSAVGEPDCQDARTDTAETVEALFGTAVGEVTSNDTVGVQESELRLLKRDTVLRSVLRVLDGVPFEAGHGYHYSEGMAQTPYRDMGVFPRPLTVKLRGRPEAPAGAEGAQFLSARGANQIAPHGALQRLLDVAPATVLAHNCTPRKTYP
jgi:hypothetical protein